MFCVNYFEIYLDQDGLGITRHELSFATVTASGLLDLELEQGVHGLAN